MLYEYLVCERGRVHSLENARGKGDGEVEFCSKIYLGHLWTYMDMYVSLQSRRRRVFIPPNPPARQRPYAQPCLIPFLPPLIRGPPNGASAGPRTRSRKLLSLWMSLSLSLSSAFSACGATFYLKTEWMCLLCTPKLGLLLLVDPVDPVDPARPLFARHGTPSALQPPTYCEGLERVLPSKEIHNDYGYASSI